MPAEVARAFWCGDMKAGRILFGQTSFHCGNQIFISQKWGGTAMFGSLSFPVIKSGFIMRRIYSILLFPLAKAN